MMEETRDRYFACNQPQRLIWGHTYYLVRSLSLWIDRQSHGRAVLRVPFLEYERILSKYNEHALSPLLPYRA